MATNNNSFFPNLFTGIAQSAFVKQEQATQALPSCSGNEEEDDRGSGRLLPASSPEAEAE